MGGLIAPSFSTATEEPKTQEPWSRDIVTALEMDGKGWEYLPEWQNIEQTCVEHVEKVSAGRPQRNPSFGR